MKTTRQLASTRPSKRILTTLGDVIAAAYAACEGSGRVRRERAAVLLTASPLSRRLDRRVLVTR
jgi:hypothetical protein